MIDVNNFADILRLRCAKTPDEHAFTYLNNKGEEEQRWTYANLDNQAQHVAFLLRNSKGNVLLLYPPGLFFVAALFGCFYAGRVAVPTFPPSSKRTIPRLRHIVKDANISTILTVHHIAEKFSQDFTQIPQLESLQWIITDRMQQLSTQSRFEVAVDEKSLALLQYTSGSTRDPLGTMIKHKNLMVNSAIIAKAFQHTQKSVGVIWLPPYHDMGLIGGILQPVYVGFPCVLMPPMSMMIHPVRWLKAISHYRATTSGGPNFAYNLCCQMILDEACEGLDLSCWQVAFNGAEPINDKTLDRFTHKFKTFGFKKKSFLPCYGLAESTLCATYDGSKKRPNVINVEKKAFGSGKLVISNSNEGVNIVSCGFSTPTHKCCIVDPVNNKEKKSGEIGEIWLSGESVAAGYWNQSTLTGKTFQAKLFGHEECFLRTGDLGAMMNNSLFVLGRIKDTMIIRGRNHYPHDIEVSIMEHCKNIEASSTAVFSIAKDEYEQLVVAQEVRTSKYDAPDFLEQIILAIRRAVFEHEQLQVDAVILLKRRTIPKTFSGKTQRFLCQKMYLNDQFFPLKKWNRENIFKNL